MVDIIRIEARWIVPVIPRETVLENHALVVRGAEILDLLPSVAAQKKISNKPVTTFTKSLADSRPD